MTTFNVIGEEGGETLLQAHVTDGAAVDKPRKRTKTFPRLYHHHEQGPARAERQLAVGPFQKTESGLLCSQGGQPFEVIFLDP